MTECLLNNCFGGQRTSLKSGDRYLDMQHSINRIFATVGGSKGAVKVGFHLKAVLTSFNMAFVPISRSRFKQRQFPPLRTLRNVLRFCVNFWVTLGHFGKEIFFLKDRLNRGKYEMLKI